MPSLTELKRSINDQLVTASQEDSAFRQALLANPKAAIEKRFGFTLPKEIELKVVEESPTTNYLVLPAVAGHELSESDLESVAGGSAAIQVAIQAYQTWMTVLKSTADSKAETQKQLARFR